MDSEASAGPALHLFQGGGSSDAARSCPELVPQQHNGGSPLCGHREDVVEEAGLLRHQVIGAI